MKTYHNPIIAGFNPDPSICRVGDDFYLVTSTFEFFPGVPIYHSRNLTDWQLIGHCLTRDSQLPLSGCRSSGGIYAPTLRWHDGTFYMITTNVSHGGNFIVYTNDIRGEWSEPQWVDQAGIDPSLFFDHDGTAYFCGTSEVDGEPAITAFVIEPKTGRRLSDKVVISRGSGGRHPEAPHLYRIGRHYYLLLAEGGTEYGHQVTLFRGPAPFGPFEPCPRQPVLSHRDFGHSPIQATGHADLVEDRAGRWWLVCLAIRQLPGRLLHHLGRETFLAPMDWQDDGWPVVGDDGHIAMRMSGCLPQPPADGTAVSGHPVSDGFFDDFQSPGLNPEWTFVRNPVRGRYQLGSGVCFLDGQGKSLDDPDPCLMMVRQKSFAVQATTKVVITDEQTCSAGLTAYYTHDYYYALLVEKRADGSWLTLRRKVHDLVSESDRVCLPDEALLSGVELRMAADTTDYRFYWRTDEDADWQFAGKGLTAGLCTEGTHVMTFTGTWTGLCAQQGTASFHYLKVEAVPGPAAQ